jgi:transcriptional regulator with XRE-family HTH domain
MTATAAEKIRFRLQVRRDLPSPELRRALRESAGLSQQEIADATGVTRQAISNYEAGRTPQGPVLDRYVDVLRALREGVA